MFCFLCRVNFLNLIHIENEKLSIKQAILQHFWFQEDILQDEKICDECWLPIKAFHELYNNVEKIHKDQQQYFTDSEIKFEDEKLIALSEVEQDDVKIEPLETIQEINFDTKSSTNGKRKLPKRKIKTNDTRKVKNLRSCRTLSDDEDSCENEITTQNQKDKFAEYERVIKEHLDIKCPFCSENMDSFTDMTSHCKDLHEEVGYMVCCERKFKKRYEIHKHIMEHKKPPERLICDLCCKKFKTERSLKFHKKEIHTPDEERPYACDRCPKKFTSISVLKQHLMCHDVSKKFVCPIAECNQAVASKGALKLHMKIHDGSNEYVCDVCSKIIKGKTNLEYHKKTHDDNYANEKVQCPICGAWVKSLRKHNRAHSQLQLECNICGKKYSSKESLKTHIKFTHLTGKEFHCTLCEKSFKRERSLKEHMAGHTGDILYTCPYCPKTFNSSANMYSHKKRDHRKEWVQIMGPKVILDKDIQDTLS